MPFEDHGCRDVSATSASRLHLSESPTWRLTISHANRSEKSYMCMQMSLTPWALPKHPAMRGEPSVSSGGRADEGASA